MLRGVVTRGGRTRICSSLANRTMPCCSLDELMPGMIPVGVFERSGSWTMCSNAIFCYSPIPNLSALSPPCTPPVSVVPAVKQAAAATKVGYELQHDLRAVWGA